MKRLLLAAAMVLATAQGSQAITVEGGAGGWREMPSGWIEYKKNSVTPLGGTFTTHADLKDNLHFSDKTKATGWFKVEHAIPLLPDVRVQYTPMKFTGSGRANGSFTFGSITVNGNDKVDAKLKANQLDVTLYYHLPFLRTATANKVDLKAGINVKVIDGYARVRDLTRNVEESKSKTIPAPMLHLSAEVRPIELVGFYFSGDGIGYSGSKFYETTAEFKFYPVEHLFVGVGYRYQRLKIDDISDVSSDIKVKGAFAEAGFRF